jgi:dihydrodipicolinate synthase/N-acetylneuraminate lyase
VLGPAFWRGLCSLDSLVAIKVAPFDRYRTWDVARAVAVSGRTDVALYTGNDDSILVDLLTPLAFEHAGRTVGTPMVGGLLGQWAVGTRRAVELHARCRAVAAATAPIPHDLMREHVRLTDLNAALFDAAHGFRGCIAGIQETLRRLGLLASAACLDPGETLSAGQADEIDRTLAAYPDLVDAVFVAQHRDVWLAG